MHYDEPKDSKEMWARIDAEAEELRTRRTPLYVHKRIMDSIPDDLYSKREPWYTKRMSVGVVVGVVVVILSLAAGIAIGKLL